jgi:hypothetical protein
LFEDKLSITSYEFNVRKNVWKILQYGPVDTRCLTENLSCAHDDIIIGDFDTPEKNVIGLDDSIAPEAVDLTKD